MRKTLILIISVMTMALLLAGCSSSPTAKAPVNKDVILATTTSTQDSGLLDVLIPMFEQKTGYKIKTVAVGTGQALAMGEKGEADILLVHAPEAEKKVVASGAAINRLLVMHNDFIIVGPPEDKAGIKGLKSGEALAAIAKRGAVFVSRGDDSGTHKMELNLWTKAGIKPQGEWYNEAGSGMGATLKIANEKRGYALTDRATYLAHKKILSLDILVEGDPKLLNIYHVMMVNPEKYSKVNRAGAQAFSDFLIAPETQAVIAKFGSDQYGQPLFFADAGKPEKDFE